MSLPPHVFAIVAGAGINLGRLKLYAGVAPSFYTRLGGEPHRHGRRAVRVVVEAVRATDKPRSRSACD